MSETGQFEVRNLVYERQLAASPDQAFDAWTQPFWLKKWFVTEETQALSIAEIDLRAGAKYRLGIKKKSGELEIVGGIFKRCSRPELLSFTWSVGGGGTQQKKSLVEVHMSPENGGCKMILHHRFIPGPALLSKLDGEWQSRLQKLEDVLKYGAVLTP